MPSRTTPAGLQVANTPAPASFANGIAGGLVGYQTRTTSAGPPAGGAADITDLQLTFTANASRVIWLRFWCAGVSTSDLSTYGTVALAEGSNVLAYGRTGIADVAGIATGPALAVDYLWVAPSSGSHTIRTILSRIGGTGNVVVLAGTDAPIFTAAFDVGPSF